MMLLNRQKFLAMWCVVLGVVLVTFYRFSPPKQATLDAVSTEFSSARALVHLRTIAKEPHALGTAAHARVRDYLFAELTKLGLTPQIQKTSIATEYFGSVNGAEVENILARIPGRASTKAVALVAHYDSVPASRGASDNGAGVVTLLETARALLSTEQLQNDVILILTDAEENGLLGARAFVAEHPWAHDVGVFFNFEARGNEGASTMFRSSQQNGDLIPGFAKAVSRPITNSLVSRLSQLLPNDTDFSVLTKNGIPGFDFAYASGLDRYHTFEDSVDRLDPRSIQHHGSYALELARHFGNVNLRELQRKENLVYFDLLGWKVVYYPNFVATLFGFLNLLLFVVMFWKTKKLVRATLISIAAILASGLAAFALRALVGLLTDFPIFIAYTSLLIWPTLLVSLAAFIGVDLLFSKKLLPAEKIAGAHVPWVILSVVTGVALPDASYIFQWPVLCSLVGFFAMQRYGSRAVHVLALAPALIILTGLGYMIFVMEGGSAPYVTALPFGIMLSFLIPLFEDMPSAWKKHLVLSCFVGGILAQIIVTTNLRHNDEHPLPASLTYGFDADTKQALWITDSSAAHHWPRTEIAFAQSPMMPVFFSRRMNMWQTPAPSKFFAAPHLDVLMDETDTSRNIRTLKLKITSKRNADCIAVWEETPSTIREISVNGKKITRSDVRFSEAVDKWMVDAMLGEPLRYWEVRYCNIPESGLIIDAKRDITEEPMRLRVVDDAYETELPFSTRATNTIPTQWGDRSMVSKSYTL